MKRFVDWWRPPRRLGCGLPTLGESFGRTSPRDSLFAGPNAARHAACKRRARRIQTGLDARDPGRSSKRCARHRPQLAINAFAVVIRRCSSIS